MTQLKAVIEKQDRNNTSTTLVEDESTLIEQMEVDTDRDYSSLVL